MVRSCVASYLAVVLSSVVIVSQVRAQGGTYENYREAYYAGVKAVKDGNLAAARPPLEAARQLAQSDRERLQACEALMVVYRELPDIGPMRGVAEYIITNKTLPASRSLTRGTLLSFIHKRGMMNDAIENYEARLEKTPEDATVLYILAEAYATYKKDPAKSAALAERLAAVEKKAGKADDPTSQATIAQQFVKAGKLGEGAALYEKAAAGDAKLAAWNYKEAASAWRKAGDPKKAVAAAKLAVAAGPEKRSELLAYFWHKTIADVFLDSDEPKLAIPQYEAAIASTKIDGYKRDCQDRLARAKAAAEK